MSETFSIGDLSREFEVTTRSIRHYEDLGLLAPSRSGQNRIYSARDRVHLKLILRGRRLGFSLKEIGELLELYDAPNGEASQLKRFIGKMRQRRQTLLEQRQDIDRVLEELDDLEKRCARILETRRDENAA
ncbi:MAG TPA: MerR family DNA-binding transcriptional regulator [Gammaproteobacteria bacterium]|nr:MerR family DNA-binding transcriptional regulator [Gammaproteobacteria bacterium]